MDNLTQPSSSISSPISKVTMSIVTPNSMCGLINSNSPHSLGKYPIPSDALPSVLEAWFSVQSIKTEYKTVRSMKIRQAQWVARLYRVIKHTKALIAYSQIMADFEGQAEISGLDYYGSQWTTLEVFGQMSGKQFTHEEMEKLTGLRGHYVTRVNSFNLRRAKQRTKETRNETGRTGSKPRHQ